MRLTVDVRCEKKVLMKLAAFVFLSTVACAMAQGESWHSSELKFGDLGDFKLENGAVIRDCRIAYHTSGNLNDDKSNVVLWPTWFTGSSKQLIPLAGSDGYVDPSRYFVIFVDALGNGISSSPSNREFRDQSYSRCHGHFHGGYANVPVDRFVPRIYGQSSRNRRFSTADGL